LWRRSSAGSPHDRVHAFDRAGMPSGLHPSRATMFRIAKQLDLDYVVLGTYNFDGHTFHRPSASGSCEARAPFEEDDRIRDLCPSSSTFDGPLVGPTSFGRRCLITSRMVLTAAPLIRWTHSKLHSRCVANSRPTRCDISRSLAYQSRYSERDGFGRVVFWTLKQYEPAAAALSKVPSSHPSRGVPSFLLALCDL